MLNGGSHARGSYARRALSEGSHPSEFRMGVVTLGEWGVGAVMIGAC